MNKSKEIPNEIMSDFINIINKIPSGVFVLDQGKVVKFVNTEACRMLQKTEEELKGKGFLFEISTEKTIEAPIVRLQGKTGVAELKVIETEWQGEAAKIIILSDVTEKKYFVECLEKSQEKMLETTRIRSEFHSTMSHEIRTPLNTILGLNDVIAEDIKANEPVDHMSQQIGAGKNLLEVINNILDFSKIEANELVLKKEPFNVKEIMDKIIERFSPACEEQHIDLDYKFKNKFPETLVGDSQRFQQVINNLVNNAIKFTRKGEITIEISSNDKKGTVTVKDTGVGITKEKINQEDSTATSEFGGKALGLVLSQKLAVLFGGGIDVSNEGGKGSSFSFSFEIRESNVKEEGPLKKKRISLLPKVWLPLKVLIVDDSEDNLYLIKIYLKPFPFTLTTAKNGQEAYDFFIKEDFDIVLLDMQMPILDGRQTAFLMRQWEKKLKKEKSPIIALSGESSLDQIQSAFNAGCDFYLIKPIKKNDLLEKIAFFLPSKVKSDED